METRNGLAAALAALVLFSTSATAQRFYIGASGGASRVDSGFSEQASNAFASYMNGILAVSDIRTDAAGGAGRLLAGIRLSDTFALEADYTRLGDIIATYTTRDSAPRNPELNQSFTTTRIESELEALGIALVAHARILDRMTVFGRAGVARTRFDQENTGCLYFANNASQPFRQVSCGNNSNLVVNETRPVAGLGVDWRVAERFAVRASWDRYFGVGKAFTIEPPGPRNEAKGEFDIDYFGIGASSSF